jgi:hypothetical protein
VLLKKCESNRKKNIPVRNSERDRRNESSRILLEIFNNQRNTFSRENVIKKNSTENRNREKGLEKKPKSKDCKNK